MTEEEKAPEEKITQTPEQKAAQAMAKKSESISQAVPHPKADDIDRGRQAEANRRFGNPDGPEPGMRRIYVSHVGVDAERVMKDGEPVYILKGSVNGKEFRIACDKHVDVPDWIAGALENLIKSQTGQPIRLAGQYTQTQPRRPNNQETLRTVFEMEEAS